MPVRFYVYPYKTGSKSAKALAKALGGKLIKREGSRFEPGLQKKVINWGASEKPPEIGIVLNSSTAVKRMGNKLEAFRWFSRAFENPSDGDPTPLPRIPAWTTDRARAVLWLSPVGEGPDRYNYVVSRGVLTGHSGQGIIITDRSSRDTLPEAPLYVEFVPKDAEYRIHVFNGEVIDVQRKVRDPDREPTNWKVRSHANGFIYTRNDSEGRPHKDSIPEDVLRQARKAMVCSELTFGAVDVIWNASRKKAYVLEINTAPGLEGETINVYATAIKNYFQS